MIDVRPTAMRCLLAGAAALAIAASAQAQEALATAPPGEDGLAAPAFYLEADTVTMDDGRNVITASGEVEVRYQGRTLRAGEVVYEQGTGVVTARRDVQIINADGTAQFADAIVLDETLTAGIVKGFSTRLEGDVKLAADSAVRRSETLNELNRAIYTPCPVCVEDGRTKGPTWSISADKVVQDRERKIIYYRNARITILGVPVFYAPVFWHADPSVERQSGLLPPKIEASRRRGLSYEQPYLHVISPSEDVVISPQLNSKINPFLNAQWRKRFYNGQMEARGGYTYENDLRGDGDRFGDRTHRSYVLANGAFDVDAYWRWGFSAERTSDDLLFDKYEVGDVYEQRGLVATDDHRLTSQLFAIRQDQQSYLSVSAISIQGLRPLDVDRTFPAIAPLVEGRWEPQGPVLGGRLRVNGSAVALTREQSQYVSSQEGVDSRRATIEADWRRTLTFSSGLRVAPFAQVRGDAYSLDDLPDYYDGDDAITRAVGVVGADISFPLYRRDGDRTIVLEPLAQVAISPDSERLPTFIARDAAGNPILDSNGSPIVIDLDEDSSPMQFDETNLFRTNRSPGFDLYEGGQRLNLGGRASVMWDDGRTASLLVGRSFRSERDLVLPSRSGLQETSSDWIVAAESRPLEGVSFFSRARFDSDSGSLRRLEAGADVEMSRGRGFVRYLRENEDFSGVQREDIDFAGDFFFTKTWGVTVRGVRDIEQDVWRRQELGAIYRDDCLEMAVVWVHEETFNRTLGPSDSLQVRLTLATLGDKG